MLDYTVVKDDSASVLYRIRKSDGSYIEVCKLMNTASGKLLQIDVNKLISYKFKSKHPIKFKRINATQALAIISDSVKVYKAPHHATYSNELLRQNRLRYYLGGSLKSDCSNIDSIDYFIVDDKRLANNMLEYIAEL